MNRLIKTLVESFFDDESAEIDTNLLKINIYDFDTAVDIIVKYINSLKIDDKSCESDGSAYVAYMLKLNDVMPGIEENIYFTYSFECEISNFYPGSDGDWENPPEPDYYDKDDIYTDLQIFVDEEELEASEEAKKAAWNKIYGASRLEYDALEVVQEYYERYYIPDDGYYD